MKTFISLLSSGLDSPIAAYLMIKQHFSPVFLSFLTSDDSDNSMKKKVIEIVKILTKFTDNKIKLYLIDHDPNLESFKERCERKLTCVLCKRLMLRISKELGKKEGTNLIVTGDILGEQASQTLDNLYSYNEIIEDFVILRPLIGFDKLDVIRINEEIGLYETISQSSAGCQYNPQYPETHAKSGEIKKEESFMNFKDLIDNSLNNAEILFI